LEEVNQRSKPKDFYIISEALRPFRETLAMLDLADQRMNHSKRS